MTSARIPVAVLGATGAVGQAFIRFLHDHPWFVVAEVAASERSAGRPYATAARWLEGTLDPAIASLVVRACTPEEVTAPIVFSALDASVAGDVENAFAQAGRLVLSNAKNFRMEADVPLVIPEVNADHLALLQTQQQRRGWSGAIVTNPNCVATVIVPALAPLHAEFGVRALVVVTMQAISGAGYPGVPSLDILGNVIPYIGGEESKIEQELGKMLGTLRDGQLEHAMFPVSAHANRVAVEHGHTCCLTVAFDRAPSVEEATRVLRDWRGHASVRGLPSAPEPPLRIHEADDRPQPRRDVHEGRGMCVSIGRVRADTVFDLRLVAMTHNIVRGAAGGSVLNAETLIAMGLVDRKTGQLRIPQ